MEYSLKKKRKEISIRKVLGAETSGILKLLFRGFAKWVTIAFILSMPFAVYFMNDWLSEYHYRINISWTTFAFAFFSVLILVILTVSYQTLRAATANPVKYLKEE